MNILIYNSYHPCRNSVHLKYTLLGDKHFKKYTSFVFQAHFKFTYQKYTLSTQLFDT